jgi:hypothetical protein
LEQTFFARGGGVLQWAVHVRRTGVRTTEALGALAFLITFFTLVDGPTEDSVFGYGFLVGFLALAIWSIATSIARYRAVATTAGDLVTPRTDS